LYLKGFSSLNLNDSIKISFNFTFHISSFIIAAPAPKGSGITFAIVPLTL